MISDRPCCSFPWRHLAVSFLGLLPAVLLLGCFSRPFATITDPFPPAPHPPMGWNSWYAFGPDISDALIRKEADQLIANGMRKAGYEYVNVSDGWQGTRDANGVLHTNANFPDMVALGKYIHSRGFKYGIYTSIGSQTCTGHTGSLGFEQQDAQMFLDWNVDLVTYDACQLPNAPPLQLEALAYKNALAIRQRETRPVVLNIIVLTSPWQWAPSLALNMWRITYDALGNYPNMLQIADADAPLAPFVLKTGWNDLDMLQVGHTGMTTEEYRTHMTLWSMLAAPLISSTDLLTISDTDLAILTNADAIAINQDPLVQQAVRVDQQNNVDVWLKTLSQGWAIAVINRGDQIVQYTVDPAQLGITASQARDAWTKQMVALPYAATIPAHSCLLLRTL
jgi:alpha-galactosidase